MIYFNPTFLNRQSHACVSYLYRGASVSVALVAAGVANSGKLVLSTELFDFSLGKFVEGPPLPKGNNLTCTFNLIAFFFFFFFFC